MHGPGLPPPPQRYGNQRSQAFAVALRVLFALVPLLSFGFLSWVTMLRLAIVTRAGRDWGLFVLSAVCGVVGFGLIGSDSVPDAKGTQTDVGMVLSLATGVATLAYFLYADLRHQERTAPTAPTAWSPPPMPHQPQPQPYGYGYAPQPATPVPAQPHPPQPPPPQTPPPARIGQVRAELDELSELLRKQEAEQRDGREPGPWESGR
ncbi:hypothetical protein OHS33_14535 [Streptomyces sp. NBC_00536]|uniref:hypothetical protein n=1 Tax=Streptomyces sp. NBC_00536 TaxID=2975769 RepID=UPI002E812D23|nr:hypothetical protein [Streptomyces sp. NBC_00536]WUC79441.1 hypothetical protein OHS33_14535 [Streptomyces sp. NBC_00536]